LFQGESPSLEPNYNVKENCCTEEIRLSANIRKKIYIAERGKILLRICPVSKRHSSRWCPVIFIMHQRYVYRLIKNSLF